MTESIEFHISLILHLDVWLLKILTAISLNVLLSVVDTAFQAVRPSHLPRIDSFLGKTLPVLCVDFCTVISGLSQGPSVVVKY
jgi:hypothetical protein